MEFVHINTRCFAIGIPYMTINSFGFTFSSHLPSGDMLTFRMNCHWNDIITMFSKESLSVFFRVKNNSNSSLNISYFSIFKIFCCISTIIKTSISVNIFQHQRSFWTSFISFRRFIWWRDNMFNLHERIKSWSLITFIYFCFGKHIIIRFYMTFFYSFSICSLA
jgi:hypothetical protein